MSPTPDTATAARAGVTVERTRRYESDGVVARFHIYAVDPPVVCVVDGCPSSLPVEAIGFEDDAAPVEGRIEDGRVIETVTVADGTEAVVCGATFSEPPQAVDLRTPTIRSVEELEFIWSTDDGPRPTANGGCPEAEVETAERSAPAGDARPTAVAVDASVDGLAERTAELNETFEAGDPAGDLYDRVDAIQAALEVVAGDVRSVRSELASVEERLAELERFRASMPPRDDEDPRSAALDRRLETIVGRANRIADGLSDDSTDDEAPVGHERLAALESDLEAFAAALEPTVDSDDDERLADVERLQLALDADDESR
jgi:hypothetical protein